MVASEIEPGEPHAAGRGPEHVAVLLGADGQRPQGGRLEHQGLDVGGEGPVAVVVLAVHVGADGPADGHLPGPRGHHRPQAERHQRPHQASPG